MKKLLVLFLMFLFSCAFADNVMVKCLDDFEESKNLRVEVVESAYSEDLIFYKNDIINAKVVDQVEAKRLKRKGYLIIKPISIERNGETILVKNKDLSAKVVGYSKKDWKKIGEKAGLSAGLKVGSHFVPGFSQMFYFSKGVIKPAENESRLKSGVEEVYENSPFAYLEKGQEFSAKEGDLLILKFQLDD